MSSVSEQRYQRKLALKAVTGLPREDIIYAIFNEFAILHQQGRRFATYPQMCLKWKPDDRNDRRSEVPDFGLGNFTLPAVCPSFKLRCGVEAKRALEIMTSLPTPNELLSNPKTRATVAAAFNSLSFQAENQAKAAYKNGYPLSPNGVQWILLVGPYWILKTFGPFSEAESTVRAHKISGSADFEEAANLMSRITAQPPPLPGLYLLGTPESYNRLEEIIASTDQSAQPLILAMNSWYVTAAYTNQIVNGATRTCLSVANSTDKQET